MKTVPKEECNMDVQALTAVLSETTFTALSRRKVTPSGLNANSDHDRSSSGSIARSEHGRRSSGLNARSEHGRRSNGPDANSEHGRRLSGPSAHSEHGRPIPRRVKSHGRRPSGGPHRRPSNEGGGGNPDQRPRGPPRRTKSFGTTRKRRDSQTLMKSSMARAISIEQEKQDERDFIVEKIQEAEQKLIKEEVERKLKEAEEELAREQERFEKRKEVTHDFQDHTYHGPGYCGICHLLLVGAWNQGQQCAKCKFNVHHNKNCQAEALATKCCGVAKARASMSQGRAQDVTGMARRDLGVDLSSSEDEN